MTYCKQFKHIIKVLIFVFIFLLISDTIQRILIQKWTYLNDNMERIMPGFYEEEKNTIDVLMLGTSSIRFGVSPMEIYETYGIKSYNLATNLQPLEASYFVLCEALKSQRPKVVVLDASSFFVPNMPDSGWRYVLDNMSLNRNKYGLAKEYIKKIDDVSMLDAVIPLAYYHERWKNLSERDFSDLDRKKYLYSKGFCLVSAQLGVEHSREERNKERNRVDSISSDTVLHEFNEGIYNKREQKNGNYGDDGVIESSLKWLLKINELCAENDIELMLTHIPNAIWPTISVKAWSEVEYNTMSAICAQHDIEFTDMEYDEDVEIDWLCDTCDGGAHLNFNGAKKISSFLGQYLADRYGLTRRTNVIWDADLEIYRQIRDVCIHQMETNFNSYIKKLPSIYHDKTIIIAAADDMFAGLNKQDVILLQQLGLQSDFSDAYRYSYLAVIEDGLVKYEAMSNNKISYSGEISDLKTPVEIVSAGWGVGMAAEISIGGIDYSVGGRGLNIVVYDNESGVVLDSVCFDTCSLNHEAKRKSGAIMQCLREYEDYIIEHGARQ